MRQFPSPHCHPQSLDSASTPEAFAKREVELGSPALTVTDHGTLGAAYKVYALAKKNNLTPVIGCLLPGQEVHTIGGMKTIEEIRVGDLVLTHTGRWMPVTKTMSREYSGTVYTIKTARKGVRGLTITEEHPVLVSDRYGQTSWVFPGNICAGRNRLKSTDGNKWKSAKDLEVTTGVNRRCQSCNVVRTLDCFHKMRKSPDGVRAVCKTCCRTTWTSYAVMPKLAGEGAPYIDVESYFANSEFWFPSDSVIRNKNAGGTHTWNLNKKIWITEDLARFLGLFFAEGSASRRRCSLTFNIKEQDFVNFCVVVLRDVFSIEASVRERPDKGTIDIWFTNVPVGLLLGYLVGVGARNKRVPKEILCHPNVNIRKSFWRGAAEGDGTKRAGRQYIKLSSQNGVWGLRCLISDFGAYAVPKYGKQVSTNGKTYDFCSVNLNPDSSWRRSEEFKDFVAIPIRSVTPSFYRGSVFNIEVAEDHSYVTDFALHNCEAYFRDDNCPVLTKHGVTKTDTVPRGSDKEKWAADHPNGSFFDYNKYYHLTLGFRDYAAYLTAVKLISKADSRAELHGSERKALFAWEDVEELAATNTTLGSGCLVGIVSRHLIGDNPNRAQIAKDYFERLHHLFKDRFYIEVFPHVCSHNYVNGVFVDVKELDQVRTIRFYTGKTLRTDGGECKADGLERLFKSKKATKLLATKDYRKWNDLPFPLEIVNVVVKQGFVQNECSPAAPEGDVQWGVNRYMMGMARKYKIPVMISDDSHFVTPDVKIVQDVKLSQMGDWQMYSSYHRMSSSEAFVHFNKKHNIQEAEFESWVDNGLQWVEGFKDFKFDTTIQLPTRFYPEDTLGYTKQLIQKHGRMPKDPVYLARLKQELDLFHRNGTVDLLPYFFVCSEISDLYSNQGVLTGPARGSGGGALLSYLLGITSVDPIKYNLSLDRFLTKDRIESHKFPDIDSDFPSRDLLCGMDCATVEVEAEDGTKHVLPEDFKMETTNGTMTVRQAIEQQAEFKAWW